MLLFICNERRYPIFTLDAKTAFLLGDPLPRKLPLFVQLPRDIVQDYQLAEEGPYEVAFRLLKAAYGLSEAPLAWYLHLVECLQKAGFRRLKADPCLFVLYLDGSEIEALTDEDLRSMPIVGLVGCHVDDLLCGGAGQRWDQAMKELTSMLKFGPRKVPPVIFCGINLSQDIVAGTITQDQTHFVSDIPAVSYTHLTLPTKA